MTENKHKNRDKKCLVGSCKSQPFLIPSARIKQAHSHFVRFLHASIYWKTDFQEVGFLPILTKIKLCSKCYWAIMLCFIIHILCGLIKCV